MSYGNWKHILGVFKLWKQSYDSIFIIKPTNFEMSAEMFDFLVFLFIYFWKKVTAELSDECQTGGVGEIEVF